MSNRIGAFLHLKTFLCVQDEEHGILKSLKAINFISKNPHYGRFHFMVNNNPTAVSCTSFNRPFYKECVPLSCYWSTFLLFMHKFYYFYANKPLDNLLLLKVNVKNKKVCDETKSPSLLLRGFAGFALQISYYA